MAKYISSLTGPEMDKALLDMNNHISEAWAVGERNGTPVTSGDETYENNAKYYANQASASASEITNMTVQASTLQPGQPATVNKSIIGGVVDLAFGIPQGTAGTNSSVTATDYGVSASQSTQPSTWQGTIPTLSGGQFLWMRLTWNDGNYSYIVARQGVDGSGTGDMTQATYDPTQSVALAGGIPTYVDTELQNNVIKQASVPTTATVGYVGQHLIDTTTQTEYVCVDTTGGSYTWKEVGSGGGVIILNTVSVSTWTTNSSDVTDGGVVIVDSSVYGYKADITATDVTSNDVANVIFAPTERESGNYAPYTTTGTDTVTIYSKVNTSITIPTIICEVAI